MSGPPYYYKIKPKMIKFVMRMFGIETKDIAKALKNSEKRVCQIIGGRSTITREELLRIKRLINDEVMGRPLSTVELAERIK